jgi:hypothetical protein
MFPFNHLPYELQDYINALVLKLIKDEHKERMQNVFKEHECLWHWVIYGACINSIHGMYEPIHILHHRLKSNPMINYLKILNYLPYVKPSMIILIKKHPYYICNS